MNSGAGVLLAQQEAFAGLFTFFEPLDPGNPLAGYPSRGWERSYCQRAGKRSGCRSPSRSTCARTTTMRTRPSGTTRREGEMCVQQETGLDAGGMTRAMSVSLYASPTGLDCRSCHFDPNGGAPLFHVIQLQGGNDHGPA